MADWQRTHTCDELRPEHVGQTVTLNGWVLTTRDYNNQLFIDLRDRYGLTQVVFEADSPAFAEGQKLGREFCIAVTGTVRPRLEGKERLDIHTGAVEVDVKQVKVLNSCPALPFEVNEFSSDLANEEVRLHHRYLDLRRPSLQQIMMLSDIGCVR